MERLPANPSANERFNALENVITRNQDSYLLIVTAEDPVYVVGYMADVRGLPVSERKRIPKQDIVLRMSIAKELIPKQDAITYGGTATA